MRRPRIGLCAVAIVAAACVPTPGVRSDDPSLAPGQAASAAAIPPATPAGPAVSPAASPSFIRPTPNPSPTFLVYEVKAGDTLTSIARLFGTTARSIAYWNRSRYPSLDPDASTYAPNRIVVGWMLQLIPTAVVDEDDLPDPTPSPTPRPEPSVSSTPSEPGANPS